MNKKGSHVDWVISMGVFIIYIFALFILLRPGIRPVYRPTTLLDILQNGFEGDTMWIVKSVPLFIRVFRETPEKIAPRVTVDDENNHWNLGTVVDSKGNLYFNEVVYNADLKFKDGNYYVPFYFRFHQSAETYSTKNFPKFLVSCTPSNEEYCKAELGIVEDTSGLSSDLLKKVQSSDYNTLKMEWGVPVDKEFAVYVDDELDGLEGDKLIGSEPIGQMDVFVRRLENRIVNKDGSTIPAAVYLQIW